MGEAKRRKAFDPTFSHRWQHGPGLVVSNPIEITPLGIEVKHGILDPQELRFSLLFWDRLAWPEGPFFGFGGSPDDQFLAQVGILSRPWVDSVGGGEVGDIIARTHIQAFLDLERREPGHWALAQGENSLLLRERILEVGRGALVELHRAIPVPDKDVPLNDILEFRTRRRDELVHLRDGIGSLFTQVSNAVDKEFELRRHIEHIDSACADLLKIAKESKFRFRLTNLKASFEMRPFDAIIPGGTVWYTTQSIPLAVAAGAAGVAAGPLMKITIDFGMRGIKARNSSYRYVYSFHKEVF